MTQQELLEAIKKGDPMAMCIAGDVCVDEFFKNHDAEKSLLTAEKWYEKAAKTDSEYFVYALYKLSTIKAIWAKAYMEVTKIGVEAEEKWEEVLKLSEKVINMLNDGVAGAQRVDKDKAIRHYYDVKYEVALCNYVLENFQLAMQLTEKIDAKRYRIIYWNSLAEMNKEKYVYAIKQLEFIYGDTEYGEAVKGINEEIVYAITALRLSSMYREIEKDLNKSVKVLNFVKNYFKNESLIERVDGELAHYKQGFLGSWKYIN